MARFTRSQELLKNAKSDHEQGLSLGSIRPRRCSGFSSSASNQVAAELGQLSWLALSVVHEPAQLIAFGSELGRSVSQGLFIRVACVHKFLVIFFPNTPHGTPAGRDTNASMGEPSQWIPADQPYEQSARSLAVCDVRRPKHSRGKSDRISATCICQERRAIYRLQLKRRIRLRYKPAIRSHEHSRP